MPVLLDDLQPNKLYSKESFLPVVEKNKKKGSAVFLLSPDNEETIRMINNVYGFFRNPNLFNSYYMEKDINLIINESMIQNIDRDIVINEMSLSNYVRLTITDPKEIKAKTGYDSVGPNTCILFTDSNNKREVAYVIITGSTILKLHSISPELDREIVDFAVNTVKCTVVHKDIDKKYKKILKDRHDFKFVDGGPGFSSNFISFEAAVNESCLLSEGMTRINMEIAMWKAQAKLLELILKHRTDETWMSANFKSMKNRLHKIPLPGFVRKIDDSIDGLKDELENTKATIEFMTEMAAFELKDHYDLSDVTKSYNSWIRASKCSKSLKLKLIREVKDSYKDTIKLYKMNLKRYEVSSTVEKRTENVVALVGKTFSIFSFLTGGPLGILKDVVMKSILPKSQKVNVLSVAELEAKIAAYEKIVEELEELEDEIKADPVNEGVLSETPLTSEQKKNLKDSDYGLPSKKAYPMPDKSHVLAAIRMFNHVDTKDEKTLANAIIKKIKEFDMEDEVTVSSKNRLYNYVPDIMKEEVYIAPISEEVMYTNDSVRTNEVITFFENTFNEDATYNKALKRVLYSERIRNQKEILVHYDMIKQNSDITKTYLELDKYKGLNLFIDMTYYIESFIKNNYLKLDKGVNLFFELIDRFLKDKRIDKAGYTKKTIFIPVEGWNVEKDTDIWDYKYNINPISIFFRLIQTGQTYKINNAWKSIDFVFIGKTGYFKLDNSVIDKKYLFKYKDNVDKLVNHNIIPKDNNNSKNAIVMDIISRLENPDDVTHSGIKINNLTGGDGEISKDDLKDKIDNTQIKSDDDTDKGLDPEKEKIRQAKEKELIDKVKDIADKSSDTDEALSKMENDEDIKKILQDIKMSSPNKVDYSPTRVARMNSLTDKFVSGSYKDKTIGDILYDNQYYEDPLPETSVPIDSVNEEWKHLKGINAAKVYDVNSDIFRILYHFSECTVPVAIRDYSIEDTSTSEDSVDTWTVQCEDINGKRFTLKFDVPKIINNRFMKLRGNEKVMGIQLMNLPIIKTDLYTTQITSNYNKIFLSPVGNSTGKSFVVADRILRAISKYEGENISYNIGDNSKICRKYDLPIDYIDLASYCMDIKIDRGMDTIEFLFNQDIMHEKYGNKIKDNDKLPIGIWYNKKTKTTDILYSDPGVPVSTTIASILNTDKEFNDIYSATHIATSYTYSSASIMSTNIPVAVLIGYSIGLFNMLDRAKINYEVYDKRPRYDKSSHDIIKLSDAFIIYELNYDSSMLLNGLKGCNLDCYSIKEVNSPEMWLDFLDLYGGRIKSDGLDMFYDLMFDPITKGVCNKYGLPDNYIDGLLYANILLSDNKYNKHTDITGNRFRSNEIIAGYVYKALCNSYSQYRRGLKIGRESTMTIKQSAVIDLILADNTESDYSTLSPLLEFESANAVSFKGLSGMNSDRAYGLDKRTFDKSMVNVLAMSTGFAANAGINRQSVIDPNIDSVRGYINSNPSDLNITQTFCMGEALTPYGVTSDDSFRTAMTFTQTAKHGMRTTIGDPLLVTTGADEALVYLTSDSFSHKAKGKGKIKEKTDDYLVIEYEKNIMPDGGNTEVVDLRERMCKNSDGGFYQSLKLDTDYKAGDTVKLNDIVAIDKLAFSNTVGPNDNYAYNLGTFIKFAVVMSDEGFEDSCRSTEWLAKAMSSTVVIEQEYNFNKDTNIYYLAKKGQEVQEGEPILIFQNAFDDEDANALVRALKADNEDIVEELGRIVLTSKVTGVVKDIKVRRCVDTEECSPTMQKVIKDYEKSVSGINKAYAKYQPDKAKTADPTYKLPATGKLKNSQDSVLITIYIAYQDDFGVSDKTVCYSALKGVSSKEVIPAGQEAFSTFRPDEKIHYIQSEIGDLKRMVGSIYKIGSLNKVLVETHRAMCDIMGIKWKYYDEWDK